MDVKFVQPFFRDGKLWCWLANTGHWPDTGGMVPGGFSANATEVEQEGLRLPPVKLYKKGVLDDEILSIILSNIRIADQRIGDIKAQAAALATGRGAAGGAARPLRRRHRRCRDRRAEAARGAADAREDRDDPRRHLRGRGLRRFRRRRRRAAAGSRMRITKTGGSDVDRAALSFDMSGSSPPCQGPMNSVIATTRSSIYLAVKHVFPEAAINAGTFEPLHIVDPEGTFLYARYPRPVSGCAAEVSQRIAEAVFAALGKAIPEQLFGAPAGTSGNLGVGGFDPAEEPHLRDVRDLGRRLRRQPGRRRHLERLLDDRHLEDDADRDHGAALPGAVRGVLAARRLGRRRRASRRLRRQLPHPAAPRRGARLDGHGPRPRRPAGRAGRRRRRHQQGQRHPRRRRLRAAASLEGPGHRDPRRRRHRRLDAGRRRLRPGRRRGRRARVERDVALGYYIAGRVRARLRRAAKTRASARRR